MKTNLTKTEKYSYSIVVGEVLLLLALACSCSARTVTKQEDKKDSIAKTKETATASINETVKESTKSDSTGSKKSQSKSKSFLDELEFESADPTKESSITENGITTTFKNMKGKKRKSNTETENNSLETVNLIKTKNSELKRKNDLLFKRSLEYHKTKRLLAKASDRKQFNWGTFVLSFWWLWILIALAVYLWWKRVNVFKWFKMFS